MPIMIYLLTLLGIGVTLISVVYGDDTIVQLPTGIIKGTTAVTTGKGVKFWAFQGVPYAAPPIGHNRFKPPQPVDHWKGILQANSDRKVCFQTGTEQAGASEDCLYLNIYTPEAPGSKTLLPVILNIHGGTFIRGNGYGGVIYPQYFMEHGVVIVSINYRLGPFGFLSTNDAVIPGNMGLKDQQYAMRWTKQNIHLFGGDPNKITIMGQSAGAASVSYQVLSPSSKGLFRAAIAQSGSALNTWAYQRNARATAYGIAQMIDPKFNRNSTSQQLLDFLLHIDAKKIDATGHRYGTFAPVIEVHHEGAMITESMYQAAAAGRFNQVPYLASIASEEGIIAATNLDSWKNICKSYDQNPRRLVDDDMGIENDNVKLEVGNQIKHIYTQRTFEQDFGTAVQYHGDNRYMRAPIKFAELISTHTTVYFYQFSYHGVLGGNTHLINGIGKVGHGEDMNYLWAYHNSLNGFPASDIKTVERYVTMVTNFAKYMNPTPRKEALFDYVLLPRALPNKFHYLDLDTKLSLKEQPRQFSFSKWVNIFLKYAKKPLISF